MFGQPTEHYVMIPLHCHCKTLVNLISVPVCIVSHSEHAPLQKYALYKIALRNISTQWLYIFSQITFATILWCAHFFTDMFCTCFRLRGLSDSVFAFSCMAVYMCLGLRACELQDVRIFSTISGLLRTYSHLCRHCRDLWRDLETSQCIPPMLHG